MGYRAADTRGFLDEHADTIKHSRDDARFYRLVRGEEARSRGDASVAAMHAGARGPCSWLHRGFSSAASSGLAGADFLPPEHGYPLAGKRNVDGVDGVRSGWRTSRGTDNGSGMTSFQIVL